MNPSIGQLSSGKFYVYLDGYNSEPFIGSLEEVEVALGLHEKIEPRSPSQPNPTPRVKTFKVVMTFQYPAWDETDGVTYHEIIAATKAKANAVARRMARNDGHLVGGKGRVTFTAYEL